MTPLDLVYLVNMKLLAIELHDGQVRRFNGEDYYLHPCRVAALVERAGGDVDQIAASYLHDTIEDCNLDFRGLVDLGVRGSTAELVAHLSHPPQESYSDYVRRVASHPRAWLIKRADTLDNLSTLPPGDKLWKRYLDGLAIMDECACRWANQTGYVAGEG